jgi:hypothetical protein
MASSLNTVRNRSQPSRNEMIPICMIDIIVVTALVYLAATKGVEEALPFFAFVLVLAPGECRIILPGLFDLTAQRVATVTLLVLCVTFRKKDPDEQKKLLAPLKYLILLILGWTSISTLDSVVVTISLKTVLSSALDFYLLYYIITNTVTSTETVHRILRAFITALVVCCIFGWLETYFNWRITDLFPVVVHRFTPGQGGLVADDGRVRSTFPHAILFANALTLGIPWSLHFLAVAKTGVQKTYLWIALILMLWNLYKTMSRGPWLALILSAILLLLFAGPRIRKYLLVISLMTIAVLVVRPGVRTTLENTYAETNDPDSARGSSYQYRYDLMHEGEKALANDLARSAWGFGPGSFYYLHLQGVDPITGHTELFDSCDSAFINIMVESGYIGLLLVMGLLLKSFSVCLKGFIDLPKPANSLCLIFLISLVAFSFMMFSVMNWGWGQQSSMLWILLGLASRYPRLVLREETAGQHIAARHTAAWGGLCLLQPDNTRSR